MLHFKRVHNFIPKDRRSAGITLSTINDIIEQDNKAGSSMCLSSNLEHNESIYSSVHPGPVSRITLVLRRYLCEYVFQIAKPFLNRFLKSGAPGGQRGQAAIIHNAVESIGAPNIEVYVPDK